MINCIGWLGSFCFAVSAIPQVWKCLSEGHANGLSRLFLILWLGGEICFLIATLGKFGWVNWLMFTYIFGAFCVLVILYYKFFPRGEK